MQEQISSYTYKKQDLSRIIEVEAENKKDAVSKIEALYRQEKIVLDDSDYVDTKIEIYRD